MKIIIEINDCGAEDASFILAGIQYDLLQGEGEIAESMSRGVSARTRLADAEGNSIGFIAVEF